MTDNPSTQLRSHHANLWYKVVRFSLLAGLLAVSAGTASHAVPAPVTLPDDWVFECVDCPHYFRAMTPRSLGVDGSERLHVVYGAEALYHAWTEGGVWTVEIVDDSHYVGQYAALEIDADDGLHVVYYDEAHEALQYAVQAETEWQIETIDDQGLDDNPYPSVATDASGQPHVSYYRSETGDLMFAYPDGGGWQIEAVDTAGDAGLYTSLALDGDGYPHISYHEATVEELRYAHLDASGWHTETVVSDDTGSHTSLALDGEGQPHISYQESNSLMYAYRDTAGWHHEIVEESGPAPPFVGGPSLRLTTGGQPRIAYTKTYIVGGPRLYPYPVVQYAERSGESWSVEELSQGGWTALVLDGGGEPHIACLSADSLKHLWRTGGSWASEVVDVTRDVGQYSSLAVDRFGGVHVGALDAANRKLRYGHRDQAGWQVETVTRAGWPTGRISLAVDRDGYPHILFDDYGRYWAVAYAYQDGDGWQLDRGFLFGIGYSGYSIATDGQGRAHISISDDDGGLGYGYWDSSGQFFYDLIEDGSVGDTDLATDPAGWPHIAYEEMSVDDLKYAYQDVDGWHTVTVDAEGMVGAHVSIALDGEGHPHISYYNKGNSWLEYAAWDGAEWQIETVDDVGDVGRYNSLAVRGDGRAHISYYDATNGALKYAVQDDSGWQILTLEDEGDVGLYTSLDLDPHGRPHISYYDAAHRDLKHAYVPFEVAATLYLPSVHRE